MHRRTCLVSPNGFSFLLWLFSVLWLLPLLARHCLPKKYQIPSAGENTDSQLATHSAAAAARSRGKTSALECNAPLATIDDGYYEGAAADRHIAGGSLPSDDQCQFPTLVSCTKVRERENIDEKDNSK